MNQTRIVIWFISKSRSRSFEAVQWSIDLFRRALPQQLADVPDYLDNILADLAANCPRSPSGSSTNSHCHHPHLDDDHLFRLRRRSDWTLDHEFELVWSHWLGSIDTFRCESEGNNSRLIRFSCCCSSTLASVVSIQCELMRAFSAANGNTKSCWKLVASCNSVGVPSNVISHKKSAWEIRGHRSRTTVDAWGNGMFITPNTVM